MSDLSEDLLSIIPVEYHIFLKSVSAEVLDSLKQSLPHIDESIHPYLQVLHLLERTIAVYTNPPRELLYMIGRIAYCSAEYALLNELFQKYNADELVPFYARTLIFQNKFDEGVSLCQQLEDKRRFENTDPTTIFLFCETMLTKVYAPYFMGDFETFDKIIKLLSEYTTGYQIQKSLGEYMSDVSIYEQILNMMRTLRGGDPEGLKNVRTQVDRWIDSVKDLWVKGYFYNLSGISYIQNQDMDKGEECLLKSMDLMEKVRDLRTYSAVGANLGTLLILEGRREDGRKFIEEIIEPFVILGNYPIAMTHMLFVSKQYLDSSEINKSLEYLKWAESLTSKVEVTEPATFSHFCYLYSKFRDFEQAALYLNKLKSLVLDEVSGKVKEDADTYSLVWYYLSQAYYSSAIGNIKDAEDILGKGITLADKNQMYDSSLELTFLLIQTKLRKYILTGDELMISEATDILNDLSPLIGSIDNRYFNIVIRLIEGYLHATRGERQEISKIKDLLITISVQGMENEVNNFFHRMDVLFDPEGLKDEKEIISKWLSKEQITIYFVNEAIRLLNDLQFQHFEIKEVDNVRPETIMIVQTNGITAYTHKFNDETTIDAHLISALLMAMSSFSKEVLGEGMLRKIEQDKHILLIELLNEENVIVLVVKKETYSIRKQFKRLVDTLIELNIAEYLEAGILLSEGDPQFMVIDGLVKEIFGIDAESDAETKDDGPTKDVSAKDKVSDKTDTSMENKESSYSHLREYLDKTDTMQEEHSGDTLENLDAPSEEMSTIVPSDSEPSLVNDARTNEELVSAHGGIVRETPLTREEEIYTGTTEEPVSSSVVRETPLTREEEIYTGGTSEDEELPTFMRLEKDEDEDE